MSVVTRDIVARSVVDGLKTDARSGDANIGTGLEADAGSRRGGNIVGVTSLKRKELVR